MTSATLTRAEQIILADLDTPRSARQIARRAGLYPKPTERHLIGLAQRGLAVQVDGKWVRA